MPFLRDWHDLTTHGRSRLYWSCICMETSMIGDCPLWRGDVVFCE